MHYRLHCNFDSPYAYLPMAAQPSTLCLVSYLLIGPGGLVLEHPLWDREVVGSNPGRAIPKALKMVPVAILLGAQHYNASTGFSSPNKYCTTNFATITKIKSLNKVR